MSKKYFVYISSSFDDLKTERRELIKIVTELGAVPITMEGFDFDEEHGQGLVKKAIFESDYFINLTAYKCGQMLGKSFSLEFELTWAERFNVPVFSFIIDEQARWKASKKEKDTSAAKVLEVFKNKLRELPHATWTTSADLYQKIYINLTRVMNLNPGQGWIRGDQAVSPATANELSRLISENNELRKNCNIEGKAESGKHLQNEMRHCIKILAANKISLSFWYTPGENWENTKVFRHLKLFKLLVPELSTPKNTSEITRFLGNILNPDLNKTVRKDNPTPTNTIKKIMADFSILKLAKSIKEGKNGSGDDGAWEITDYGREVFALYRLRQMHKNMHKQYPSKTPNASVSGL